MNNKKILFILHLPPPIHGAALIGGYIKDSDFLNAQIDAHYINLTIAKNLQDISKGGLKKLWRFICLLFNIIWKVITLQPNLVYITPNACGGAFYKDFIVVQLLKLLNQKIVLHYHNKGIKTRENRKVDHWLYTHFFRNVKLIILLAESLYSDIQKYVERKNIHICHNGIPTNKETYNYREIKSKKFRFLFLSNLLINKGIFILLDALQKLKIEGYFFICDIIGGETNEVNKTILQEEILKRHLSKDVLYHGAKFGNEKSSYFSLADCFVFPTLNECFPLVLLEAMKYQLPCISTYEGAIPEIIADEQTGLLVSKSSSKELAEKMAWMIDNPKSAKKMGIESQKRFKERFTLSHFEDNLKAILLSALED